MVHAHQIIVPQVVPAQVQPPSTTQVPPSSTTTQVPPPIRTSTITVTEIRHPNVTEWILPTTIQQASIGQRQGSNACTVIAVYSGQQILQCTLHIPEQSSDLQTTLPVYCQLIHEGNQIYDSFNMPAQQPNLEVKDVLTKSSIFQNLHLATDTGVFFTADLKNFIEQLVQQHQYMYTFSVLIVPPDKSLMLCFNQTKICIFDSHSHRIHGGVIATGRIDHIQDFVSYLERMVLRDWGAQLGGSNMAILKQK